jgi:hypothetical protein
MIVSQPHKALKVVPTAVWEMPVWRSAIERRIHDLNLGVDCHADVTDEQEVGRDELFAPVPSPRAAGEARAPGRAAARWFVVPDGRS